MSTDVLARLQEVLPGVVGTSDDPAASTRSRRTAMSSAISPLLAFSFALFLPFAIAKIQWAYPVLDIPYLPRVLGTVALLAAVLTIPTNSWQAAWKQNPTFRAVAAMAALCIVTIPIAYWPQGSWSFLTGDLWKSFTIFFIGVFVFRDRQALRRNLAMTLLGVAGVALFALSGNAKTVGEEQRVVIGGFDPNDLAAMFVACLPLALWMARGGFLRWIFWHCVAFLLAMAVIPTASRGGMLGLAAVGLSLVVFASSWPRRLMILGFLALGVLGFEATATPMQRARFNTIFSPGSDYNATGSEGRWRFWKTGMKWMVLRPTGLGVNGFRYKWDNVMGGERVAHNAFIQIGVDLGFLGLGAIFLAFGQTMTRIWKIRRNARAARERQPARARSEMLLAEAGLASLIGLAVTAFFLAFGYHPVTYFILAAGAGITYGSPYAFAPAADGPAGAAKSKSGAKAAARRPDGWRSERALASASRTSARL